MAKWRTPGETARLEEALSERAHRVLVVAHDHGHRNLVLGAWGCGVFRNDPGFVAATFRDLLAGPFAGAFDLAVFAILDRTREQRVFEPFCAAFTWLGFSGDPQVFLGLVEHGSGVGVGVHRPTPVDGQPSWVADIQGDGVENRPAARCTGIDGVNPHPVSLPAIHRDGLRGQHLVGFVTPKPIAGQLCRSEERRVGKECRSRWSPYH